MPSFDVVSEVDSHELTNAVDQTVREIGNRYDFKGTKANIELNDSVINLTGESEFQLDQILDILYKKMAKRGIDSACLAPGSVEVSGMLTRQKIDVKQGVDKDNARKIVKKVKDSKLKVQAAIQGEQVRITGKKRDDLQDVIAMLKAEKFDLPLQYINFRE